ncbi:terpene synthase family protein [Kibdelosporangium aridum]|uniref:terpene synthase family protein n=1 Tax=Kibdelosporangium aridum TaxID=2030 RepID=UPI000524FA7D
MPQDVELPILFPSRISPDFARAESRHLEWPRSQGLLPSQQAAERHLMIRCAEVAARCHPEAVGTDLDLGVDQMSWFFLFDDLFDSSRGQDPAQAAALVDAVNGVLDGSIARAPIVAAFADLWKRSCEGMSGSWRSRTADNWRRYFDSFVDEARLRQNASCLPEDYMAVRRVSVGVRPILDLAERLHHRELPETAVGNPHVSAMQRITVDVPLLDNDICSVEKEERRGDHNLVLIWERHHHWSRTQAILEIRELVRTRVDDFVALEDGLPHLCRDLGLDPPQRHSLSRYVDDTLRPVMRGIYDWHRSSERYTSSYIMPSDQTGHAVDLGENPSDAPETR